MEYLWGRTEGGFGFGDYLGGLILVSVILVCWIGLDGVGWKDG